MNRDWPTPPSPHDRHDGIMITDCFGPLGVCVEPPTTSCKHGDGPCETCGTTDRRDAGHRTVNGRGAVARLMKK